MLWTYEIGEKNLKEEELKKFQFLNGSSIFDPALRFIKNCLAFMLNTSSVSQDSPPAYNKENRDINYILDNHLFGIHRRRLPNVKCSNTIFKDYKS